MSKTERIIAWSDKTMAFSFYALIYFLPISIALTETCSGLAIFCYLIKRGVIFLGYPESPSQNLKVQSIFKSRSLFVKAFKPKDNYLNKPLGVFLLVNFVSILISQNPSSSLEGFLGKILQGVFIFFTFFECMRSMERLKVSLIIFAVSNLLICSNGLYQYFGGHEFIHGQPFDGRVSSSFRQANDYATYLVVVVAVLFCLFVWTNFLCERMHRPKDEDTKLLSFLMEGRARIGVIVLLIISLISLGLTYSRGAWVAFILCVLLFGMRNLKTLSLSVLLISIFLVLFYPKLNENRPSITNVNTFSNYNNRLMYWSRSIRIVKDYPVMGSGVNTYSAVQWRYNDGLGGYPHNSYLQMTAETGVIGLFSFLWLLLSLYKNSFRNLRKMHGQELKFLLMSFLTGLSGLLMHSFFDTTLYSVQLSSLLWLLMGLIVSLQYMEKANHEIPPVSPIH